MPGKSNAFEISRRLGLPENLIDDAKKLLSSDSVRFEDVIANAEYHRQVAEREREIARQASAETVKLRDEAEKLRKQMEDQRENTIKKAKADARRIMEHFDLAQYFTAICGATLDETRTDKAEVIAYALETAGITDKTGLVMVGDREHDVLGAKKNGLPCIGAVYGYGTAEELTAAGAAALADTVEELHKLLLG